MKATIEGVRYDTENAILICNGAGMSSRNGHDSLDAWAACLYRAPRARRFFLVGSGGPMTRFAPRGTFRSGEALHPVTHEEAESFVRAYATADEADAFDGLWPAPEPEVIRSSP